MTHAEASRRSGRLAGMKTGVGNNSKGKNQEHLVTHLTPKTLPWSSKPRLPVLTVTTLITQWFFLYRPHVGGELKTLPAGIRVPLERHLFESQRDPPWGMARVCRPNISHAGPPGSARGNIASGQHPEGHTQLWGSKQCGCSSSGARFITRHFNTCLC